MSYRKELLDYISIKQNEVNKILSYPHNMNKEEAIEMRYKKAHITDFYRITLEEEIAQENDLMGYIKVLMRWK